MPLKFYYSVAGEGSKIWGGYYQPVQERHSFERHSRVHSQNLSESWAPLISKLMSEDWAPLIFGGEWSLRVHSFKKPKNLWNFNPNP